MLFLIDSNENPTSSIATLSMEDNVFMSFSREKERLPLGMVTGIVKI